MQTPLPDNKIVVGGTQPDATYLNTVRWTITTLDSLRLTAVNFATIGAISTLAVAASAYYYFVNTGKSVPALAVLAFFSCMASIAICAIFLAKVWMFDNFIGYAVRLAAQIEKKIGLGQEHGITHHFERHRFAGTNGWIFTRITLVLGLILFIAAFYFAVIILWGLYDARHPGYVMVCFVAAAVLLGLIAFPFIWVFRNEKPPL